MPPSSLLLLFILITDCQPPTTFLAYTVLVTPDWSGFPPAPGFVKSLLVPYVFSLPNRRVRTIRNSFVTVHIFNITQLWKFVTKA